jgi:hypothetical protein
MNKNETPGEAPPEGQGTARMTPRTRQLIISLMVACAMFMQNLDCQAIAHTAMLWLSDIRAPAQ